MAIKATIVVFRRLFWPIRLLDKVALRPNF
jgi:hypothetical protein